MSDDEEADQSLLALLRQSLGITNPSSSPPTPETGVLPSAEYIYNNSIDVAIDAFSTRRAATNIYALMQSKQYSTQSWSAHDLHPKAKDEGTLNFIFTMDLLNFSFWSEKGEEQRFTVEYRGRRWTGYWSLVACLQRAIDDGASTSASTITLSPEGPGLSSEVSMTYQKRAQVYPSPILISGKTRKHAPRKYCNTSSARLHQSRYPCCTKE